MDIHLFVLAVIKVFVSAQEELLKTNLLFQSYNKIFTKIISSEIEELFEKHIVQHLDNVKKGIKNLGDMISFIRTMLSNLKARKRKFRTN